MIKVDAALNQRFSVTCVAAKIVRKNAEGKLVKRGGFSFALIIGIKASAKIQVPIEKTQSCQSISKR